MKIYRDVAMPCAHKWLPNWPPNHPDYQEGGFSDKLCFKLIFGVPPRPGETLKGCDAALAAVESPSRN